MNKRRRYLAKRRRSDQRWARRMFESMVRRYGFCPKCGNHPMNPLPTCSRCGWLAGVPVLREPYMGALNPKVQS